MQSELRHTSIAQIYELGDSIVIRGLMLPSSKIRLLYVMLFLL